MSSKLVRKLLQQTAELSQSESVLDASRKKRKRDIPSIPSPPVTEEEILQRHVRSMIHVDNVISAQGGTSQLALERQKQATKRRRRDKKVMTVGNSRSSSSAMAQYKPEPTFDKRKHAEAQKKKSLKAIAKLLAKSKKQAKR